MFRALVIAVMLVLLPLRGWAGDLMSLASVAQATGHSAAGADCHERHALPGDAVTAHDRSHPGETQGSECSDCQICQTVALVGSLPLLAPRDPAVRPALRPLLAHPSAEPVRGFKPPIT